MQEAKSVVLGIGVETSQSYLNTKLCKYWHLNILYGYVTPFCLRWSGKGAARLIVAAGLISQTS